MIGELRQMGCVRRVHQCQRKAPTILSTAVVIVSVFQEEA